jgi:hypothetical protein
MTKEKVTHMYPLPGTFDERIKARIAQVAAASEAFAQTAIACPEKRGQDCMHPKRAGREFGAGCTWFMCPKGDA